MITRFYFLLRRGTLFIIFFPQSSYFHVPPLAPGGFKMENIYPCLKDSLQNCSVSDLLPIFLTDSDLDPTKKQKADPDPDLGG